MQARDGGAVENAVACGVRLLPEATIRKTAATSRVGLGDFMGSFLWRPLWFIMYHPSIIAACSSFLFSCIMQVAESQPETLSLIQIYFYFVRTAALSISRPPQSRKRKRARKQRYSTVRTRKDVDVCDMHESAPCVIS